MSPISLICLYAALLSLVNASPLLRRDARILSVDGEKRPDGYIVKFRDGVTDVKERMQWVGQHFVGVKVDRIYEINGVKGFAGSFNGSTALALSAHPDVEYVAEDQILSLTPLSEKPAATKPKAQSPTVSLYPATPTGEVDDQSDLSSASTKDPRWNLYTVSHKDPAPSKGPYEYIVPRGGGEGVDVYVLDTGINVSHEEFGGRARLGKSIGTSSFLRWTRYLTGADIAAGGDTDGNGHGTHVSATIGGRQYGVAPNVNLIAVKVLDSNGKGPVSSIIEGLVYVMSQHMSGGGKTVVNLSLKGGASVLLDGAVKAAVAAGIHVVVAAGNDSDDASKHSPGRVKDVVTVGASDQDDARAWFSSYGDVVDVYGPGVDVTSAWIGSNTATMQLSGTSQATPHVAGTVALILSQQGKKSPDEMSGLIKSMAKSGRDVKIVQVPAP
ncbi:subtilisin-like serine protease [Tulasnella sp. 403]|nr:subtilisin-like serine protease [Tulasnella sp. 403]